MYRKMIIAVLAGCLPLIALGDATNQGVRLKITCRTGAIVNLEGAALLENGLGRDGTIPQSTGNSAPASVRLKMDNGGTVTIPWDNIERIAVGDQATAENTYALEVSIRNMKEPKVGKSCGNNNTIVGKSDMGAFSIALKDVKEIAPLPESGGK